MGSSLNMVGSGAGRRLVLNESAIAVTIEVTVSIYACWYVCGWTCVGWVVFLSTGNWCTSWGCWVGCTVEFGVFVSDTEYLGSWGGWRTLLLSPGLSGLEKYSNNHLQRNPYRPRILLLLDTPLVVSICFLAFICSNSSFSCASSASILAVASLCFVSSVGR